MAEQTKLSCCQKQSKRDKAFLSGLVYGLLPHTGCIAFIIFTILGLTAATAFLKPLMLNPYFFYLLIILSFIFATISAIIYLKKRELFSLEGIKIKWKYLSVLYGTSIGINLILFMLIFPLTANMATATPTGLVTSSLSNINLEVKIPCPGHAPLISEELKTINGVQLITFRFPNYFDVDYDASKTSQQEILSLEVFDTYPATKILGDDEIKKIKSDTITSDIITNTPAGCSRCGSCSGVCGGLCGG